MKYLLTVEMYPYTGRQTKKMDLCPSEKWAWHLLFSFEDSLKYKYRIAWFPSCLSGSSKNGLYWPDPSKKAQDLTGFKQKRRASDRNQAKKAWIWPDPSKKPGSDLTQAEKTWIWPDPSKTDLDLTGSKQKAWIWSDPSRKCLDLTGFKQKMPQADRIQAEKT